MELRRERVSFHSGNHEDSEFLCLKLSASFVPQQVAMSSARVSVLNQDAQEEQSPPPGGQTSFSETQGELMLAHSIHSNLRLCSPPDG